ncbi:4-diphosphocytidyl-2-C-methyl-D-erythritol kinase [Raineyella antarctica]|uniref:4-diphosphocytidyl-2-C-methyl-D-erythritol kinase n=1 Tax=Raineyella antarctica TaxID=1577474 RepID=A0A1G6GDA8_9ACTN|nr:4-(cytidine 5'-diphospho)-2-C-methyl-D-erythritol kinase [Raineyella antarctica]SDB79899.1 4-diphosphocytidyl-2-C-methyl-D-erythritol kinase [Raineyella antarctica]
MAESASTGERVRVRVPGKINLALCVGPRRPDGFHDLATVFQSVSLADELTATPAPAGVVTVEVAGADAALVGPAEDNLAVRAARLLAATYAPDAGAHLQIVKGIPVAGGMAGGSADAAAALLACDRLWGLDVGTEALLDLAARLGSDVPFTAMGGTAVGHGRGERLRPVRVDHVFHWVLVTSGTGLSTPAVFRRFDELHPPQDVADPQIPDGLLEALQAGDPVALAATLRNDLAEPALDLRPDLGATLGAGTELGALGGLLSGSGPTCAFLAADAEHARALADGFRTRGVGRDIHVVEAPGSIGFPHAGRG